MNSVDGNLRSRIALKVASSSTYVRATPRRGPRPNEIELLARLLDAPQKVEIGPLGRCMKRGWIARLQYEQCGLLEGDQAMFEITQSGRDVLAGAVNGRSWTNIRLK